MRQRIEAIELTLRQHTSDIAALKTVGHGLQCQTDSAGVDMSHLVKKLDKSFADWNNRIASVEKCSEDARDNTGSLMQLFASRIDKLEEDFATMMRSVHAPPGIAKPSDNAINHDIGSPAPTSTPLDRQWSPLNPQRADSYGHQPRREETADPWSQSRYGNGGVGASMPASSTWAAGAGSDRRPFEARDWTVDKKATHELKSFNGEIANYDNWRRRVRDHFTGTNLFYKDIFDMVESEKSTISWSRLATLKVAALPNLDWQWIASQIWSFIGRFMTDTLFGRRLTLTCGEEFNGLELWRALWMENHGGSVEMKVHERNFFIHFPKCAREDEIQTHLGQWCQLRQKFGNDLPEEHVLLMFHNTLPDSVLAEVRKQRDLVTLNQQVAWVYGELGRYTDSKLSKWNTRRLEQQLKTGPKNATGVNALSAEVGERHGSECVEPPPMPDMASMQANLERMVAAAFSKAGKDGQADRGRSATRERTPQRSRNSSSGSKGTGQRPRSSIPSPKFHGCWCCGEEGHSRQKCPKFDKIKAANGGKVPKDYEGAYEKSMAKPKAAKVNAVSSRPAEDGELNETYLWPLLTAPRLSAPQSPPTATGNRYEGLTDDDDSEESEVVKALAQLTSHVKLGSEKAMSQSDRKRSAHAVYGTSPKNRAHIKSVVRQVLNGEISLPNLDLENDADYECVWALVDSGAGVNCGTKKQFPGAVPTDAPEISLTTADGKLMRNQGAMKITTRSTEGVVRERTFYNAPVEMPILSVACLALEGDEGSSTTFRRIDGFIEDNHTQQRQHFVKRKGVYFMKLFTKRADDGLHDERNTGFTRPGHA